MNDPYLHVAAPASLPLHSLLSPVRREKGDDKTPLPARPGNDNTEVCGGEVTVIIGWIDIVSAFVVSYQIF